MEGKSPRVSIFVPSYKEETKIQTTGTLVAFVKELSARGWFGGFQAFGHYDVAKVRAHALTVWYDRNPESTHLLMVDDDMSADASLILQMLALDEPLVGVIYPRRNGDKGWVGRYLPNPTVRNGFMEMKGVGGGFMLIRRDCVDKLIAYNPALVLDDLEDNRVDKRMVKTLGLSRVIDAFRAVTDADGILSEDYSFCERFRAAGGKVWAKADMPIGHVGQMEHLDAFLRPLRGLSPKELVDLLEPERLTTIVDVGCSALDGRVLYKQLLVERLCKVVGFDASEDEIRPLVEHAQPNERYLCRAIGMGGDAVLNKTAARGMNSLLEPDEDTVGLLPSFDKWGEVIEKVPVKIERLDDVLATESVGPVDLLKIDAQGSELSVLMSAGRALDSVVAVQVEVPFLALYKEMPSFAQIDTFLRSSGFVFHRFAHIKAWPLCELPNWKNEMSKQLIDGDAIYVRDFRQSENMTKEQWKHLAILAHTVFDAPDLACGASGMVKQEYADTYAKALA